MNGEPRKEKITIVMERTVGKHSDHISRIIDHCYERFNQGRIVLDSPDAYKRGKQIQVEFSITRASASGFHKQIISQSVPATPTAVHHTPDGWQRIDFVEGAAINRHDLFNVRIGCRQIRQAEMGVDLVWRMVEGEVHYKY
jgi:hypothetical protein